VIVTMCCGERLLDVGRSSWRCARWVFFMFCWGGGGGGSRASPVLRSDPPLVALSPKSRGVGLVAVEGGKVCGVPAFPRRGVSPLQGGWCNVVMMSFCGETVKCHYGCGGVGFFGGMYPFYRHEGGVAISEQATQVKRGSNSCFPFL